MQDPKDALHSAYKVLQISRARQIALTMNTLSQGSSRQHMVVKTVNLALTL